MKSTNSFGTKRVLEPTFVLPTCAWKLDNGRNVYPDEMRLDVKRIHIETTSFKEICLEAADNEERIRQKIMDIVIRRGKLHNPVTDTGGLLSGVVSEIGESYSNNKNFKKGDEVICNASLASIPLYIDKIISVDRAFGQIEVEGYCIIGENFPVIRKPENLPLDLLMYILNESGTIFRISSTAVGKKKFLIVGNNLLSNLLFGYAIRKVARDDAEIVCLLDKKTEMVLKGGRIDELVKWVFTDVYYLDILKPLECIEKIQGEAAFDVSVNCADIQGAETINILATKSGGTVIFANLINNYNIALYITEAISRQLDIRCADGYLEAYDEFDFQIVKDMLPYLEGAATNNNIKIFEDSAHPVGKRSRMIKRTSGDPTLVEDMVYESHAMSVAIDEALTAAKYDCNVLITGEAGTGKEKIADIIQRNSDRKMQPFIKLNCGSLDPARAEEELFGGSRKKQGALLQADNGTLFLEEVSKLKPDIQTKLLRAVQEGEISKPGGEPIKINVRMVSTINEDPEDLIEKGLLRRDLYYRLNVVRVRVPSLRDRRADIPGLTEKFLEIYGEKFGVKRTITEDGAEYLAQLDWPGNTKELENVVQRLMIGAKSEEISLIDIMRELHAEVFDTNASGGKAEDIMDMEKMVENFERNIIHHALEKYGSTRRAAKAINISQTQLVRKKNKYGL